MWFNKADINTKLKPIILDDIKGYVLPHAGTKYTGSIISHTLQFRPKKDPVNILIMYLPAFNKENVQISDKESYYHEYYVPMMSLKQYYPKSKYYGYNVIHKKSNLLNSHSKIPEHLNTKNTLFVLSVDFSHNIDMQKAIKLENTASHALFFKQYTSLNKSGIQMPLNVSDALSIVDDIRTFQFFDKYINSNNKSFSYLLHWIGRTRSISTKSDEGVGYLSFLIRDNTNQLNKYTKKPSGLFITSYDNDMIPHECLGRYEWSQEIENELLQDVSSKGEQMSRLTGGMHKNKKQTYFDIQYLYPVKTKQFIRGWHGIKHNAFYLPSVFLENTYENGNWINSSNSTWQKSTEFNMKPTLNHLQAKAGFTFKKIFSFRNNNTKKKKKPSYQLYEIIHKAHHLQ